jgi:hypothetical protein
VGWGSAASVACYVLGGLGLLFFVLVERWYGDDALLPLRLFRSSVFSLVTVVGVIVGMTMFGGIAVLPQFLQIVRGASPIQSGFLMLPLVAGIMTASLASGQLTSRTGRYKVFPVARHAAHAGRAGDPPLPDQRRHPVLGARPLHGDVRPGLGGCMQTLVLAVQNASPARDMGVVTASSTFFRQLGGTLGTAIFFSIPVLHAPRQHRGRDDVGREDRPGVPGRGGRPGRARQRGQRTVLRAEPGRRGQRPERLRVPARRSTRGSPGRSSKASRAP